MSLLPTGSSQQKLAFKALVSAPLETKETADLLSPLIPNLQKIISVFTVTEQRELLLFLADKLSALRYCFFNTVSVHQVFNSIVQQQTSQGIRISPLLSIPR